VLDIYNSMEMLIQFSEEKYNALERIYKLTCEQTDAIEEEDIDRLNELINKKQIEINTIQSLDKKFEKISDDIKSAYNIKKLDELGKCHDDVKRIEYIRTMIMNKGKQIHDIEENNSSALQNSKNQLEDKMKSLKVGKRAVSGYGYNVQNPVYFDKNK